MGLQQPFDCRFKRVFKNILKVLLGFQGQLNNITRISGVLQEVYGESRESQKPFNGVARGFGGVSRHFRGVSESFRGFQNNFKEKFQGRFKEFVEELYSVSKAFHGVSRAFRMDYEDFRGVQRDLFLSRYREPF